MKPMKPPDPDARKRLLYELRAKSKAISAKHAKGACGCKSCMAKKGAK